MASSSTSTTSSLVELVERVRAGHAVDDGAFDAYAESANQAERFLANYARATLSLRQGRDLLMESLRAVDFADAAVLKQFLEISTYVGQRDQNAWAIFKHAKAVTQRDWPAALGAMQDAIRLDQAAGGQMIGQREHWTDVASEYERAAKMLGKRTSAKRKSTGTESKLTIAYLTSSVVDDSPGATLLGAIGRNLDAQKFALKVYITDSPSREAATPFASFAPMEPSGERGLSTLSALRNRGIESWTLPGGADVVRQARMLVERIACDGADVVVVDASLADAVAWIAIANRAAPVQIALVRKRPIGATGVDHVVWLDDARRELDQSFWQQLSVKNTALRQGIDTDLRTAPIDRATVGVPADAQILMTYTHRPEQTIGRTFVDTIGSILQANPQAVYLLAGEGEFGTAKKLFDAAGFGKRVGFTGSRKDLGAFLRIADVYLAEFPTTDRAGLMQAAAVARPVVTMASRDASSDFRLLPELSQVAGGSVSTYVARVNQLLRDPTARATLGQQLRTFAIERFSLARTATDLLTLSSHLTQEQERREAQTTEAPRVRKVA